MNNNNFSRKKKKSKHQVRITEPDESITNGWEGEIVDTSLPKPFDFFTTFISESKEAEYFVEPEPNSTGYPWLQLQECPIYLSSEERLQKETFSFFEYLQPSPQEKVLRNRLCACLEEIANQLWPNSKLWAFGSFTTQLYLPESDIDVVLLETPKTDDATLLLEKLLDKLKRSMDLEYYEIRSSAKVPIINLMESKTGIQVDISIDIPKGLQSSEIISKYILKYPIVRPLSMIVRHFLRVEGLHKVYDGGLGSYAVTLLIVSFIQINPDLEIKTQSPEIYLGELLVKFLKFYGIDFCSSEAGISLLEGGFHFDRIKNQEKIEMELDVPDSPLILLDPTDEASNVAQSTHRFQQVQEAFREAYFFLTSNLKTYQQKQKENNDLLYKNSILGKIGYVSPSILTLRINHKNIFNKQ